MKGTAAAVARTTSSTGQDRPKRFRCMLEKMHGNGLNWVIARVPFSVEKTWGVRGILKVNVEVNGFEASGCLFPTGQGKHFLVVNKKMQKGARIVPGSTAAFTLTPDRSRNEIVLPEELERALNQDRAARKWFDGLPHWVRKWLTDTVVNAKSSETRRRRSERLVVQILETMEGEKELPPIMRQTFNRNPGAEKAWWSLTATRRRWNLLAIFYYVDPQSRMKRIEKTIEEVLSAAARKEESND